MGDLVLTGSPLELTLPDICARCGEPAKGRLYWECVFPGDTEDGGPSHVVEGVRAPFCSRCLAQHAGEVKRMSWLEGFIQCFRSRYMISGVICGGIAVWIIWKSFRKASNADWLGAAGVCAVSGFFALVAWGSYFAAREGTRHHTVPALTTITKSFGFGRVPSELFEGLRYRYTSANERFAEALLAANRDRVWIPSGKTARKAAEKRVVLYIVFGVAVAVMLVWDWLH